MKHAVFFDVPLLNVNLLCIGNLSALDRLYFVFLIKKRNYFSLNVQLLKH